MGVHKEELGKKLGEAIGLEMATQKAVQALLVKGLIPYKSTLKNKLEAMKKQANNHKGKMEGLVSKLFQSDGLSSSKMIDAA